MWLDLVRRYADDDRHFVQQLGVLDDLCSPRDRFEHYLGSNRWDRPSNDDTWPHGNDRTRAHDGPQWQLRTRAHHEWSASDHHRCTDDWAERLE